MWRVSLAFVQTGDSSSLNPVPPCLSVPASAADTKGRKTAAAAAKAELRPNRWFVRLGERNDAGNASGESDGGGVSGAETRELPPEMTADNLLKKARFWESFVVYTAGL